MDTARKWTPVEVNNALAWRSKRQTVQMIAKRLNRSNDSVRRALARYDPVRRVEIRPRPVRPTAAELGSKALRDATIRAIVRYANDNGLDVNQAASRLLSRGAA